MSWKVRLDPERAAPTLRALPPETRQRVRLALRALGKDPTAAESALDVRELDRDGKPPRVYRLRVGAWRVAHLVRDKEVLVMQIFPRKEGYGWMERLDEGRR